MSTAATLSAPAVNAARIQNFLMGGYDNTAADREVAQALAAEHPVLSVLNRQNRRFVERTVRQLAGDGIRQFLDLGCGLPLTVDGKRWPMVHEAAGTGARVAYVDCDPMAVLHTSAAAAGSGNVTVIEANLADPDSELIGEAMQEMAGEPVAVILASTLHYWSAPAARSIIDGYADLLPEGSAVVVSSAQFECDAAMDERRRLVPSLPFFNHSASDLESFFTAAGLKLSGPVGDVAPMSVAGVRKPAVMLGAVGVKP